MGLFYSSGCLAAGVSGSLAYAFTRLDAILGLAGWAWVFLVESFFLFDLAHLKLFISYDARILAQPFLKIK
jgi:hypothetical protein